MSTPFPARYAGVCDKTGERYDAGTLITKRTNGRWMIAKTKDGQTKVAPDFRLCRLPDGTERSRDITAKFFCKTCVEARNFSAAEVMQMTDEQTAPFRRIREENRLACPTCGSAIEILPPKPQPKREHLPPEVKQCWECGGSFTYRDCKQAGGDWGESYCGC